MAEDTRDIAIKAQASAASAHHRLDGYNGQIKALGVEVSGLRGDFQMALYGSGDGDPDSGLVPQMIAMRTTLRNTLKVAGALAGCALAICGSVVAYELTHPHYVQAPPSEASQQHGKQQH